MMDKFELEEPPMMQTHHWWYGDRYTQEWLIWVTKKSHWNFAKMDEEWSTKLCPFIDGGCIVNSNHCLKCKCIHFQEGQEYVEDDELASASRISWYGEKMYSEHKCKLWGQR